MPYRLSLLDKSLIAPGQTGADALQGSLTSAKRAEALGYHRYWLAEHHGIQGYASAAPEILAAHILAQTKRIRVGSGGVLLQHYAPYKIAETFSVLATLAPGRVDLGIGRAPGGLPLSTRALQAELSATSAADFDRKLAEVEAWLTGPHRGADLSPRPTLLPERFLLGGSVSSAEQAAKLGWSYVHAGHQDGNPITTRAVLDAYEEITGRRPALAVAAFATPTRSEAEDRLAQLKFVRVSFGNGHAVNLTSEAGAQEYARQYGREDYTIEFRQPKTLAGTGRDIQEQLTALHEDLGVTEFIIDQPVAELQARLTSIELIAQTPKRAAA